MESALPDSLSELFIKACLSKSQGIGSAPFSIDVGLLESTDGIR
jgi:hypothetical protein